MVAFERIAKTGIMNVRGHNMPRMSKSRKLEWSLFLNDRGRITFNALCRKCVHDCKQSFRAVVIECPHYRSKRAKTEHDVSLPRGPTDKPP